MKWPIQLYVCGQIISVCNSERIIKIGQYLQKLCSNEKKGSSVLTHSVLHHLIGQECGSVVKKTAPKYSQPFSPEGCFMLKSV